MTKGGKVVGIDTALQGISFGGERTRPLYATRISDQEKPKIQLSRVKLTEEFRNLLLIQAVHIMEIEQERSKKLEVLYPITDNGIEEDYFYIGTHSKTHVLKEVEGKEVIGYFHTHPPDSSPGFSVNDIRAGMYYNFKVIGYGKPDTWDFEIIFENEFAKKLSSLKLRRKAMRRGYL